MKMIVSCCEVAQAYITYIFNKEIKQKVRIWLRK